MKLAQLVSPLACGLLTAKVQAVDDSSLIKRAPVPFSDFTNNVIFKSRSDYTSWKTIYGRSVQLPDDSLLTWEGHAPEPPLAHCPIWKSVDGGVTWFDFVKVTDQVNGWAYAINLTSSPCPETWVSTKLEPSFFPAYHLRRA
ncbi:hypothetical protein QQZ08_000539 [Neonectria magnoliae]|uniref:Uncharacterized protein n=1 Tax=Neonectria magnoliae TaxID=2732573 RepID=A0ABR1IHE9_9HYPO